MARLMIDLETMGDSPQAPIMSIGACVFDYAKILNNAQNPAYRCNVDLATSISVGGLVSGSTVRWWLEQEDAARKALFNPPPIPLRRMLFEFMRWVSNYEIDTVWSHGATFDCVVLDQAARMAGTRLSWGFRDVRDTRTAYSVCSTADLMVLWDQAHRDHPGLVKHDPVGDALRQASVLLGVEKLSGVTFV